MASIYDLIHCVDWGRLTPRQKVVLHEFIDRRIQRALKRKKNKEVKNGRNK